MRRFFHAPGSVWPTMSLLPWMQISHHRAGALIMLAALTAFLNLRRNRAQFGRLPVRLCAGAQMVPTPRGNVAPVGKYRPTRPAGTRGAHRGNSARRRLFLLSLRRDAAVPERARARLEVRSLCAGVHHAGPICGGLSIRDAGCVLGRRRPVFFWKIPRSNAYIPLDAGREAAREGEQALDSAFELTQTAGLSSCAAAKASATWCATE